MEPSASVALMVTVPALIAVSVPSAVAETMEVFALFQMKLPVFTATLAPVKS